MTNSSTTQKLIDAVEQADSSASLLEAVQNLATAASEETVPVLIAALGYNNPGAAVAAVDGLIEIGEPAVLPLLQLIDDFNYGARAWAIRALAGIGDPRGLETLLEAAENDFALSVRRGAARGLGILKWHQMTPEEVPAAQQKAFDILIHASKDSEWVVRYAASVGLEGLAESLTDSQSQLAAQIFAQLEYAQINDVEISVRSRVNLALQKLRDSKSVEIFRELKSSDTDESETPSRGSGRR
jgi:phycocyanobilin lyase subunit beta